MSKKANSSQLRPDNRTRLPLFDTLRGTAMILMAVYHFCFDLDHFGVIAVDMSRDEFWLNFRAVIMSSFMGLVGVGLYLGSASFSDEKYWRRLGWVAACAAIISIATYIQFDARWTFFGVLHFVVIASLLGPWLIRWPIASAFAGVGLVILPLVFRDAVFSEMPLILTGLAPNKPRTEDFAPLVPWLGVVMIGIGVAWSSRKWLRNITAREIPILSHLGHHALVFYMTHQLVLFPIAWAISQVL